MSYVIQRTWGLLVMAIVVVPPFCTAAMADDQFVSGEKSTENKLTHSGRCWTELSKLFTRSIYINASQ